MLAMSVVVVVLSQISTIPMCYSIFSPLLAFMLVPIEYYMWLSHPTCLFEPISQASFSFLDRYPDLQKAFGSDYAAAINHFLTFVPTENRLGYVDNGFATGQGAGTRWTISNNHIFISASSRMGAGVDSLVWNNKQFINAHDHGRELQMACNTDMFTECYNPTECGGRDDGMGTSTMTKIVNVSANGHVMQTKVNIDCNIYPNVVIV